MATPENAIQIPFADFKTEHWEEAFPDWEITVATNGCFSAEWNIRGQKEGQGQSLDFTSLYLRGESLVNLREIDGGRLSDKIAVPNIENVSVSPLDQAIEGSGRLDFLSRSLTYTISNRGLDHRVKSSQLGGLTVEHHFRQTTPNPSFIDKLKTGDLTDEEKAELKKYFSTPIQAP